MSCFSCSSQEKKSPWATAEAPRVVTISQQKKTSASYVQRTSIDEKGLETTEVTSVEKEIDVKISEEYDSEDEEYKLDLEAEWHLEKRLVRRGILPSKPGKTKGRYCSITGPPASKLSSGTGPQPLKVHNTGDELQMRLNNQRTIEMIVDSALKTEALSNEKRRQRKWEQSRHG